MGDGPAESGAKVEFRTQPKLHGVIPEPEPACNNIPDWYADSPLNQRDEFGEDPHNSTIRGCMPFFDALTTGWVLKLPQDVSIRSNGSKLDVRYGDLETGVDPVHSLGGGVLPETPDRLSGSYIPFKLASGWFIYGPEDTKAWVMPPRNRFIASEYDALEFTSGIYDVHNSINPAGMIALLDVERVDNINLRAGTPIAQVAFLGPEGLVNEGVVGPMSEDQERQYEETKLKQEVNKHNYRENVWESVGSVKKETDSEGSGCPLGFDGD